MMPDYFRCPVCRGLLMTPQDYCAGCGRPFSIANGVVDFFAATAMTVHEKKQADLHATLASAYQQRYTGSWAQAFSQAWNALFFRHLPLRAGRVLEAGCGTGELAAALAGAGWEVVGMDISRVMLELAAVRDDAKERCVWVACGCERMPYADEVFDAVCFRGALHHMERVREVLAECARVLKPGGRLLLSEPNDDSLLLRFPRWLVRTFSRRFGKEHKAFRSRNLFRDLEAVGFRVNTSEYFSYLAEPLCGMGDMLPFMHRLPASERIAQALLRFDGWFSNQPFICSQSFELFVAARRRA